MSYLWDLLKNAGGEVGSSAIQRWREEVSRLLDAPAGGAPVFNFTISSVPRTILSGTGVDISDAEVLHTSVTRRVRITLELGGSYSTGASDVAVFLHMDGSPILTPHPYALPNLADSIARCTCWWIIDTDNLEHSYLPHVDNGGGGSFLIDIGDSSHHYVILSVEDVENQASRVA